MHYPHVQSRDALNVGTTRMVLMWIAEVITRLQGIGVTTILTKPCSGSAKALPGALRRENGEDVGET